MNAFMENSVLVFEGLLLNNNPESRRSKIWHVEPKRHDFCSVHGYPNAETLHLNSFEHLMRNGPLIPFNKGVGPLLHSRGTQLSRRYYSHWAGSVQCVQCCVGVLSWEQLPTILYGESREPEGLHQTGWQTKTIKWKRLKAAQSRDWLFIQ